LGIEITIGKYKNIFNTPPTLESYTNDIKIERPADLNGCKYLIGNIQVQLLLVVSFILYSSLLN
jgi:hypothetical protein